MRAEQKVEDMVNAKNSETKHLQDSVKLSQFISPAQFFLGK